jgi:hypothetical protein
VTSLGLLQLVVTPGTVCKGPTNGKNSVWTKKLIGLVVGGGALLGHPISDAAKRRENIISILFNIEAFLSRLDF